MVIIAGDGTIDHAGCPWPPASGQSIWMLELTDIRYRPATADQMVLNSIQLTARSGRPVLISGDSGSGKTSAKATIWEDFAAFTASAKANHDAALMLIAAAEAEDMTATKNALGQLGGSCKACHQQFKGW